MVFKSVERKSVLSKGLPRRQRTGIKFCSSATLALDFSNLLLGFECVK